MKEAAIEFESISKRFPGVKALDDVSFSVARGEVHAVMGENGAGKSTLMKILAGAERPDAGAIRVFGQVAAFHSPGAAITAGIATIHQELNLIPSLSVAENIFVNTLPVRRSVPFINWRGLYGDAEELLMRLDVNVSPKAIVEELSTGEQQQVEICRAIAEQPRILIMDEPTSALTETEVEKLFELIGSLKRSGMTFLYISHHLSEIRRIADRVTVLRDGRHIVTCGIEEAKSSDISRAMLGHEVSEGLVEIKERTDSVVLSVRNLTASGKFKDVSFDLHQGEVLGLAGLLGAGRTELLRAIYGLDPVDSGSIEVLSRRYNMRSAERSVRKKMFLVSEDRKVEGLMLQMTVAENITLPYTQRLTVGGLVSEKSRRTIANEQIAQLSIRTPNAAQKVGLLSGGNQQKVVLARWISMHPRILLLDQPTRGIDIGAKEELYKLIRSLADDGVAAIFVATQLSEFSKLCSRVLVMSDGRITKEISVAEMTEGELQEAVVGGP